MKLTPRLLIASRSKPTTLFPSAPEALKPLVQLSRIPCEQRDKHLMDQSEPLQIQPSVNRTAAAVYFRVKFLYLVDVLVSYWKGESETQRKLFVLDVVFVQEVGHTFGYIVKQLLKEHRNDVVILRSEYHLKSKFFFKKV